MGKGSRTSRGRERRGVGAPTWPVEVSTAMPMDFARDDVSMLLSVQTAVSKSCTTLVVK